MRRRLGRPASAPPRQAERSGDRSRARLRRLQATGRKGAKATDEREAIPGAPEHVVERARPRHCALHRDAPLDHYVSADEPGVRVVQETAQDLGRAIEGQVRDDTERLRRKRDLRRVTLDDHDVGPSVTQVCSPVRVEFDGDDPARAAGKRGRQPATAGSEVEYKVVGADARVANELGGELGGAKEMLLAIGAARPRASRARRAATERHRELQRHRTPTLFVGTTSACGRACFPSAGVREPHAH